jgi:hypothetical protein
MREQEACYLNPNGPGPKGGGEINDHFKDIYLAARNAGYDWHQIDTYMFPCELHLLLFVFSFQIPLHLV